MASSQPVALALFLGLLTANVRRVRRLFGARSDEWRPVDRAADAASSPPEPPPGTTPPPPSPERRRKRNRTLVRLTVATGALAPGILGHARLRVAGPFTVLPVHNADVRSETDGLVERVYVAEGVAVRAGEVIARLSARTARADLVKTARPVRETRANARRVQAGAPADSTVLARTALPH